MCIDKCISRVSMSRLPFMHIFERLLGLYGAVRLLLLRPEDVWKLNSRGSVPRLTFAHTVESLFGYLGSLEVMLQCRVCWYLLCNVVSRFFYHPDRGMDGVIEPRLVGDTIIPLRKGTPPSPSSHSLAGDGPFLHGWNSNQSMNRGCCHSCRK